MKAAKEPPSAEICGEAAALIDVHLREIELVKEATAKTSRPLSPEARTEISMRIWPEPVREMRSCVIKAATAEYLRRFPTARSSGATFVMVVDAEDTHIFCLFCRKNLNTFGTSGGSANTGFWRPIHTHTELCAYRMLAGQLEPVGPGMSDGEKLVPVGMLKGRALIRAAEQAAVYLGETIPKHRAKRGTRTGLRKGLATELRKLVQRARTRALNATRAPGDGS